MIPSLNMMRAGRKAQEVRTLSVHVDQIKFIWKAAIWGCTEHTPNCKAETEKHCMKKGNIKQAY